MDANEAGILWNQNQRHEDLVRMCEGANDGSVFCVSSNKWVAFMNKYHPSLLERHAK